MAASHQQSLPVFQMPALLIGLLTIVAEIDGQSGSNIGFVSYPEQDVELANPTRTLTLTGSSSGTNSNLRCAWLCQSQTNCTVFSYTESGTDVVCKLGSTWNGTRNATGSKMFYRILFGSDGYTRNLDPYRYKVYKLTASAPIDVSDFCYEEDGSAVPIGYPDLNSFKSLRMLMSTWPKKAAIVVGVELSKVHANGSMEFRTYRDWPVFVMDPNNPDPNQPWAPNEPTLLPHDKPSDIAVMMTTDGWFTVDTRTARSDALVCMRHATYEFLAITRRFHRAVFTVLNRYDAENYCRAEGAFLSRATGKVGLDFLNYVITKKGLGNSWLAGTEVSRGSGLWKFPDGRILDDTKRWTDPEQIFSNNDQVPRTGTTPICLLEYYYRWGGFPCTDGHYFVCEGGF